MRSAVVIALILGALTMTSGSASAGPLGFGGHIALSPNASPTVIQVAHRHYYARHSKRYIYNTPRRYNWQYYPYWRPYQYRYWQHYYPYGGPLF